MGARQRFILCFKNWQRKYRSIDWFYTCSGPVIILTSWSVLLLLLLFVVYDTMSEEYADYNKQINKSDTA